jgi:sulfotransferase
MLSKIHFISGLPRSGSTLLCAILKQNPRFHAGVTSPVVSLVKEVLQKMSNASEFGVFFNDERRAAIVRGLFESYYLHVQPNQVVFDTNRTWTGKLAMIASLFPASRVICCVRDVGWIVDSIEKLLRQNPLQLSKVFKFQAGSSVYARAEHLMNPENGLIGQSWSAFREGWYSEQAGRLIVIVYDKFVRNPKETMAKLYEELKEPFFQHDFDNVTHDEPDYDLSLGMPGLHKVRQKVEYVKRDPCIPPELFARYDLDPKTSLNFWNKPNTNYRKVCIL